jgi:hypothetical protein
LIDVIILGEEDDYEDAHNFFLFSPFRFIQIRSNTLLSILLPNPPEFMFFLEGSLPQPVVRDVARRDTSTERSIVTLSLPKLRQNDETVLKTYELSFLHIRTVHLDIIKVLFIH